MKCSVAKKSQKREPQAENVGSLVWITMKFSCLLLHGRNGIIHLTVGTMITAYGELQSSAMQMRYEQHWTHNVLRASIRNLHKPMSTVLQ